jgi:mono/diheme cytochrome c family protein
MKKLKFLACTAVIFAMTSCGGDKKSDDSIPTVTSSDVSAPAASGSSNAAPAPANYDPKRGMGKWDTGNVAGLDKFDPAMAEAGQKVAAVKCTACHKPTDEKLVGPGWKGVTSRVSLPWIMNFITNPDPMISVDPELQKQLEICLVRMPNQGLNDTEARQILEYMRQINGAK